jgi:hypothetical protein
MGDFKKMGTIPNEIKTTKTAVDFTYCAERLLQLKNLQEANLMNSSGRLPRWQGHCNIQAQCPTRCGLLRGYLHAADAQPCIISLWVRYVEALFHIYCFVLRVILLIAHVSLPPMPTCLPRIHLVSLFCRQTKRFKIRSLI